MKSQNANNLQKGNDTAFGNSAAVWFFFLKLYNGSLHFYLLSKNDEQCFTINFVLIDFKSLSYR